MSSSQIKIISLNCAGSNNKIPLLRDLCNEYDILLLQETWLLPDNLNFFDNVHPDFCSHSVSAVNIDKWLTGRPHGGLSILWNNKLGVKCSVCLFDDSRVMGITLDNENRKLFILNLYMPYFCPENHDQYLEYVGKVSSIIEDHNHSDVIVLGDFNATVGGQYYRAWDELCHRTGMLFTDVVRLSEESYTHVNHGSLSRTWLDHCLSTTTADRAITNVDIIYDYFLSDHLPLSVTVEFNSLPSHVSVDNPSPQRIGWNFRDECKTNRFYHFVWQKLLEGNFDPSKLLCNVDYCTDETHLTDLDNLWDGFIGVVQAVGETIFGTRASQPQIVPGWNDQVKELYLQSRQSFHVWRVQGSPRSGETADQMRQSRALFKLALRRCKDTEDEARALAIAKKFREKNMQAFWHDIKSLNKNKPKLPTTIDGVHGSGDICKLWKNKFSGVLNSIQDDEDRLELQYKLLSMDDAPMQYTTPAEIQRISRELTSGKCSGTDDIPSEFYQLATSRILWWLCCMINAIMLHSHVPTRITEVVLTPILKSSLKDPCCSANYRPIAIATSISKIIENVILNRLNKYLFSSDHQFGFKENHGTDMCIFALKEVINYYKKLNTPIFLCFIDIKSAFDRISYNKLFCLLCDRGAPKYLIKLLLSWYSCQKLCIRWAGIYSEQFGMLNGIRQGSCVSPKMFNVYVDKLNELLRNSGVGCHVSGVCTNNFSFADDMVLACPDAKALNILLEICDNFARQHYIIFSTTKTEAMVIKPGNMYFDPPNVYLSGVQIRYVSNFKYLGHIITHDFSDDADIEREIRNLYIRGNTIARRFNFLHADLKSSLFASYCYPLYTSSLWSTYRQGSLSRMKVCYNDVLRTLFNKPRSSSARTLAVQNGIRSFFENIRVISYSLMNRIQTSNNSIIFTLVRSDCFTVSVNRRRWRQTLYADSDSLLVFMV